MADYFTYVVFVSCTSLVDFQRSSNNYHKMNLEWNIPVTSAYKYDRIELYRYIGDYMGCADPSKIDETTQGAGLIYTAQQTSVINGGTVTLTTYFPSKVITTVNKNLTDISSFIDDFSLLNPTGVDLDSFHLLAGVNDNQTVTTDIGFTRRVLYYILKAYIKGAVDFAPYLLTPDYNSKEFTNHSSKTQVRHNYLHYEGDEIWSSKEASAGTVAGISRTAVDVNRLYFDSSHTGSTGRGGYAWVSDRDTGQIFQHNLKDGYHTKVWQMPSPNNGYARGFGIGIEASTGDCIACPGDNDNAPFPTPNVYRCKNSNGTVIHLLTLTTISGPEINKKRCGYGVLPLFGYPDRMLITDYNTRGSAVIYNITHNTATYSPSAAAGDYAAGGYAAASCPNGKGVQRGYNDTNLIFISPIDASWFKVVPGGGGINTGLLNYLIGVDSSTTYPNTIINANMDDSAARENFTVWADNEFGMNVATSAVSSSQCTTLWALQWVADGTAYLGGVGVFNSLTCGYDGENNAWIVGNLNGNVGGGIGKKTKLYRTAHNRHIDETIDDSTVFPQGGNSRYPSVYLSQWPYSYTNDKDAEWFLTRNHGVSTLDVGALTTQIELDPSTLDNTISAEWMPGINATAYQAWWSMVEEKMLRKHYGSPSNTWSTNYFKVYGDTGIFDGNARKWGIRIKVSDLQTSLGYPSMDPDLFYETKSDLWKPLISQKILQWSDAFANSNTSYISQANRDTLIANNLMGILVHPHYKLAQTAVGSFYINDTLSDTQKAALTTYATGVKYINLKNLITSYLYMYSDFTGNILMGSLEFASPLNKDVIHPNPTDPSLVLLVSGYQSNPNYQDTPAYCYPWKNTLPVSMSAMYSNVSGYDDFNASYSASAYMGSYLLTSFSLSTNDFTSPYYTDTNNLAVISKTQNLTYNLSNLYMPSMLFDYTYHSPSVNGLYYLPSGKDGVFQYTHPASGRSDGRFNASVNTVVRDLYDYDSATSSCAVINLSSIASIAVLERWPEPKFYIEAHDSSTVRTSKFCHSTWGSERFDKSGSLRKESNTTDAKRYDITYGVDPISGIIQDRSIARTWPISSWNITISSFRLGSSNISSFNVIADTNTDTLQDTQNIFDYLSSMEFRYGDYMLTMNVQASTTSTSSDKPFVQYIKIAEFEPFANFWAVSASTVSSNFVATDASITGQLINITRVPNCTSTIDGLKYPFVSGYAPNLTVYFQDSSEAHTFPISSYHWNFGDPFNEGPEDVTSIDSNYYTVTASTVAGDFNDSPVCWQTNVQAHTAVHTYIMPGTYDVTLTVHASCTNTSDTCARYVEAIDDGKKFYVYVAEIPPQCNGGIYGSLSPTTGFTSTASSISGGSPFTVYFNASSIIAGSFPLCRIDWDFGDGLVQRITRYPLTQITTQDLPVINISAYPYDLNDPRNIVVPHIYTNKTENNQTISVNISAYACNTNTMINCYSNNLISPLIAEINEPIADTKKLIGSRFDDMGNLIYIVEGATENTTYTIALSGELNNE